MSFFFFNDTATTEIYTLSLHDALPILGRQFFKEDNQNSVRWTKERDLLAKLIVAGGHVISFGRNCPGMGDRKSTRLNSSHVEISYAVFCLKKKKKIENDPTKA